MATLLSLAPELLQEIGHELDRYQNRELRTVCRQLNKAIEAIALSTLVIYLNRSRAISCIDQLKAYTTKSTRVTTYVHRLEIRSFDPFDPEPWWRNYPNLEVTELERQLREYLPSALATLTNTQTVIWCSSYQHPEWVYATIQDFLKTLTGFKHLEIDFYGGFSADLLLDCVHDLKTLKVSSVRYLPVIQDHIAGIIAASLALDRLNIDTESSSLDENSPSLKDFFSWVPKEMVLPITYLNIQYLCVSFDDEVMRHFRSLKSLHICQNHWESPIGSIWNCFQTEQIHLEEIHVNIPDISSSLIDYLASYSGLKTIWVINRHGLGDITSDCEQLASDFCARVLPKHCESLETLGLCPRMPGAWCFSESLSTYFESCQQLKQLTVTLPSSSGSSIGDMNMPVDGLNMVKRTASTFPFLEQLSVYAAARYKCELIYDSSINTP